MRLVSGEESPSEGQVTKPKSARIGLLEQDHFRYDNTPIIEVVMQGNPILWKAMQDKEALLDRAHEEFDDEAYCRLEDLIMRYDGYELESKAGQILEGLNIPSEIHHEPLSVLSGGYKLRALRARPLRPIRKFCFSMSPTTTWTFSRSAGWKTFLRSYKGCAMIVSHDHRFLNNFASHIIDVDYERATLYKGNYDSFLKAKARRASPQGSRYRQAEKRDRRSRCICDSIQGQGQQSPPSQFQSQAHGEDSA